MLENIDDRLSNLKKHTKKYIWKKAVQSVFGFDPVHLNLSHNLWTFVTWNKDEVGYLSDIQKRVNDSPKLAIGDKSGLLAKIDKLMEEMKATDRKTTVHPQQIQLINGIFPPRRLIYKKPKPWKGPNILTETGMGEMGKRSTGESSTTNGFHAIGTGTTAETVTDHVTYSGDLETEQASLAVGTAVVVNQTERYGTAFDADDVTGEPLQITEGGLKTAIDASGILVLRVTADAQELDTGNIITLQTNVTHQNGTEV